MIRLQQPHGQASFGGGSGELMSSGNSTVSTSISSSDSCTSNTVFHITPTSSISATIKSISSASLPSIQPSKNVPLMPAPPREPLTSSSSAVASPLPPATTIEATPEDLELLATAHSRYRRIEEDSLSGEERERLLVRRERNKQAAARCRNRRRDLTVTLEKQTEDWATKNSCLEKEIEQLMSQKEQLEFLLNMHEAQCQSLNLLNNNQLMNNNNNPSQLIFVSTSSATSDIKLVPVKQEPSEFDLRQNSHPPVSYGMSPANTMQSHRSITLPNGMQAAKSHSEDVIYRSANGQIQRNFNQSQSSVEGQQRNYNYDMVRHSASLSGQCSPYGSQSPRPNQGNQSPYNPQSPRTISVATPLSAMSVSSQMQQNVSLKPIYMSHIHNSPTVQMSNASGNSSPGLVQNASLPHNASPVHYNQPYSPQSRPNPQLVQRNVPSPNLGNQSMHNRASLESLQINRASPRQEPMLCDAPRSLQSHVSNSGPSPTMNALRDSSARLDSSVTVMPAPAPTDPMLIDCSDTNALISELFEEETKHFTSL